MKNQQEDQPKKTTNSDQRKTEKKQRKIKLSNALRKNLLRRKDANSNI